MIIEEKNTIPFGEELERTNKNDNIMLYGTFFSGGENNTRGDLFGNGLPYYNNYIDDDIERL